MTFDEFLDYISQKIAPYSLSPVGEVNMAVIYDNYPMDLILECVDIGIEKYFENMVSCEDTDIHKPNPEPILCCLKKLGIEKDEAIMVGDSPFDIKCANNAGVKSVLVDWRITGTGADEVKDAKEDFVIKEPADLLHRPARVAGLFAPG